MKKLLVVFLLMLVLSGLTVSAKTIEKRTLDNNIAYIGGYEDNTFRPNKTMSRAEAVTIIARLLVGEDSIPTASSSFDDVKGHWGEKYIACLEKEGLLTRYSGSFNPDKAITRAEFVELAYQACSLPEGEGKIFADVSADHPFYSAINASASAGLVGGYEDNTFRPDNSITRAEVVTVMNRVQGVETNTNIFGQNYNKLKSFSDIKSHWARYNILVASNAEVGNYVSPIFGSIYMGGVSMSRGEIVLQNSFFSYSIDAGGYVSSIKDKRTGKELAVDGTPFVYANDGSSKAYPTKAELKDSRIVIRLDNNADVTIVPTVKDCYIAFEIEKYTGASDSVTFANTKLSYTTESDDDTAILGISLCTLAITQSRPSVTGRNYSATAYKEFGIVGAKYAIIGTPIKYHLTALEALANDCDIKEGIFAASRFDSEEERLVNTNYFLGYNGNHETLFDDLELYKAVGIDMYSFHKGNNTFRQGDFFFHNQNLKTSYQSVLSAYIKNAGLTSKLYSYYMTPEGAALLPEEHSKEFEYIGTYKLSESITKTIRAFSLEDCDLSGEYYIAIGNELILATLENGVTENAERKQGGTQRYEHPQGRDAVVIKITGTGAHNFKALVSDPLKEEGILSGLHTYAFYIDPECSELLSDPKWQKQFLIQEEYTLAEDITAGSRKLVTVEGLENAITTQNYRSLAWDLVFIDEELIQINVATLSGNTITVVDRGHHATVATEHKAGAKIRRIAAYYSGLTPQPGSELFYYVAQLTGEAFSDGGFDMVYFDAIDGLSKVCPASLGTGEYEYYTTEFLRATLEYCDKKPITEVYLPTQYVTHSYTPAFDYANRGFKEFMEAHSAFNQTYLNSYFFATLGWYNFYPESDPANVVYEYQHTDDIDHLGTLALAYNYSMVFLNLESYRENLKNKANIDRYLQYDKLRKEGYFSDELLEKLRNSNHEYSLTDKGNGAWALVEKSYDKARLNNYADSTSNYIEGNNPFNAQTPFIRLEQDWSSSGSSPVVLAEFDTEQPLTSQTLKYTFTETVDASGRAALQVSVYGNGKGGAICISIDSPVVSDHNQMDYVIPLNFEGWKDFTLVAGDTCMYPKSWFSHWANRDTYNFKVYRGPVDFGSIQSLTVYTYGSMDGVRMGDVKLTKHENAPVVNPTVTMSDGQKITFNCTLSSSEYIEYDGKNALIYNSKGETRPVASVEGSIKVSSGSYRATVTGTAQDSKILRGRVTFGFTGDELK